MNDLPDWMNLRQVRTGGFTGKDAGTYVWCARCSRREGCTGFFTSNPTRDVVAQRAAWHVEQQHGSGDRRG